MPSKEGTTAKEFLDMADLLADRGYRLGPKIGEGSYAKVRVVEKERDGKILAAKIINRKKTSKDYLTRFLPRELNVILRLEHQYVLSTHEVIQTKDHIFMIVDYAERGDLLDYIKRNGCIPNTTAATMFRQFTEAVKYLHDKDIVHRDLKCENILLHRDQSIAISDFGFARDIAKDDYGKKCLSKTFCGSAAYASPDLLRGAPYDPKMNDIWGMGCILYIMVCASMPFDDSNLKNMVKKQLTERLNFPSRCVDVLDPDCKHLIYQLLEVDCMKRLSVDQILTCEWLKNAPKTVESGSA